MYKCNYCNREFESVAKLGGHSSRCKRNPTYSSIHICKYCEKTIIGKHSHTQHENYCKLNPARKHYKHRTHVTSDTASNCQFCGKACKNNNSLRNHERMCKLNPDTSFREKFTYKNHAGWNKGLTKETDSRVNKQSKSSLEYYKEHSNAFLGKHHSEDAKRRISQAQLDLEHTIGAGHFGKCGWYDNIYFMSTWELAYYIHMRDTDHQIQRCSLRFQYEWEGKQHYYTPDFICDGKVVEIKGFESELDKFKYTLVPELVVLKEKDIQTSIRFVKEHYQVDKIETLYTNSKW